MDMCTIMPYTGMDTEYHGLHLICDVCVFVCAVVVSFTL